MPAKRTYPHSSSGHSRSKARSELGVSQPTTSKTASRPRPPTASSVNTPNATELAIWRTVEPKTRDANTMVLIVVDSQEKKSLKRFLAKKKHLKTEEPNNGVDIFKPQKDVSCTVMLSTPDNFQDALNAAAHWRIRPSGSTGWFSAHKPIFHPTVLDIVVSRSISEITYNISSRLLAVNVMLSHRTQAVKDMYSLCVNGLSRYCGVEAWQWEYRDCSMNHKLSHGEGIFFHTARLPSQGSPFNPKIMSAMTLEVSDEIQEKFRSLVKEHDGDEAPGGSTSRGPSASAGTDKGVRWLDRYLGLISSIVGGAVGVTSGAGAFFWWVNAGGFFVKGPLGLYLSGGYFSVGALGAAGLAGVTAAVSAGLLAGTAVYYIPWGTVWNFMKEVLASVWDKIKEYARWIWEKLKKSVAEAASLLRQGFIGNALEKFPHIRKAATFTV